MADTVIVLHGLLALDGRLALWAETAPAARPAARRTRRPIPHPFAMQDLELADGWDPADGDGTTGTATLALPTVGSTPLASPELGVRLGGRGTVRLHPWLVPVLWLPASVDPEVAAAGLADQAAECRWGPSIGFLSEVTAFAADLVDRGRVLPTVTVDHQAGPAARWRPALLGADAARFEALRQVMPAVCRAQELRPDSPDLATATEVLDAGLAALVDALVRSRLRRQATLSEQRTGGDDAASDTAVGGAAEAAAVRGWFAALTSEPRFDADPAHVRELAERLDTWHAGGQPDSPVRTCLRLSFVEEEPSDDDPGERWLLEFLMQPLADPSVLVPAEQVWQDVRSPLHRWLDDPQEQLLADLGRASRLFPALDAALRTAHPAAMLLDTAGAYGFLTHAPLLSEAGFGVLLPSAWRRRPELGLALTVRSESSSAVLRDHTVGLDSIVDFRWGLALGNIQLTAAELRELARAKVPLVRLRGQWVYLDRQRLAAGLAFLGHGGSGRMTARDALRHARLRPDAPAQLPLPVTCAGGEGWVGDLLSGRAEQELELLGTPAGFAGTLRPYQLRGLSWLVFLDRLEIGACLADDMGLGKTVQLLALETHLRGRGPRPPTLLICPLSVLGNWQREVQRFAPGLRVYVQHGTQRPGEPGFAAAVAGHDLVLTTYAVATREVAVLRTVHWDRIVLDEAQHIKNSASAMALAVRQLPARHRVALTGTPVENRLAELWSIMDFLNPGLLGSAHTFRARYAVPVERHADEPTAARLRQVTRPFMLRRVKSDPSVIADLPDKMERRELCNLTAEQATLYRAVVDDMFARIRQSPGDERNGLVLTAMTRLKQVCNHPAQLLGDGSPLAGRSGKLARLEEILERVLADGDSALCFTQFARFGAMLVPHLAARFGTEVLFLHGGTPKAARDAMVQRFQSEGRPRIFLLSLKAGGTGLNLTAANHVVHLDRWWNPAAEAQATDRAFRIGQHRDVSVHTFVCVGTVEEKIDRMLAEKSALARLAVGSGEGWLTRLSSTELRDLVTLAPEAVGE